MKSVQTKKAESSLEGRIYIPGDKSISHRAVMLSAISNSEVVLDSLLEGEDILATINAFKAMRVEIDRELKGVWRVRGVGLRSLKEPDGVLDMGNSGCVSSNSGANKCPSMWCTARDGMSKLQAKLLAMDEPTNNAPAKPGPAV